MSVPRAYTTVVLAMSADGKISDQREKPARFSSDQDLGHLEVQIAQADAVLFGAGTLRAYGTCLPVRQPDLLAQRRAAHKPQQPIQIVCSYGGQLDANLRFFRQPVPRWLLTTPAGGSAWRNTAAFDRILCVLPPATGWGSILEELWVAGIHRLQVLGGGTLIGSLVQQNLIDELYLTVCPLLIGGRQAPTPVDGDGLGLGQPHSLRLLSAKVIGDEVFLHYRCCHLEED